MRKFNVVVNGVDYRVEIEETAAFAASPTPPVAVHAGPAVVAPAPVTVATPAVAKTPEVVASVPTGGTKIESPMPGTVVKIVAASGSQIKRGAPVVILESMKMENEIVATADGIVTITTVAGANVNAGDVLAVIA
ncbi:MAG: acetyl-CoA carboxylase biotin carboxyl carrier protein subunit [Christensenellaceae bacterium]|jgi:glutaconyl-CoA decarboxylase|nr:acetyl-CoA carboxylase biotin carboxyl carrier protein subunit [Christensenellaceae bacterium]